MRRRLFWSLVVAALPFAGVAASKLADAGVEPRSANAQTRSPADHPDLSGVWRSANAKLVSDLSAAGRMPALQAWGARLYQQRLQNGAANRPSALCLPRGLPGEMLARDTPWKLVQSPSVIAILFGQSLHYRLIFTDGRGFPEEKSPTWYGYSVGAWEGDTLVVNTIGLGEQTWLDDRGHPHSADVRLTERFRRVSSNHLDIQLTIDDPKAYVQPWTMTLRFEAQPESALIQRVCAAHTAQ
jgi:hypothetical protein